MKVVTAAGMREIERRADSFGLSSPVLMQLAGLGVAEEVAGRLGDLLGRRALVLVGPGNNGGDGLVTACHLKDWGLEVFLYLWNRKVEGDRNYALCLERGIEAVEAAADPDFARLAALLQWADVVIDALLGIGIARPIAGTLKGILAKVEEVRARRVCPRGALPRPYLVAVDVPTGLNADTGASDPSCFSADLTVTLGFPKVGLFLYPGAKKVGELATRSIAIPARLAEDLPLRLLTADWVRSLLPPRPLEANKGTFGKVLVVGGSANYIGAPCLASLAALRAGAGLVTLAIARSLEPVFAAKLTETTFLPLPEAEAGVVGAAATQPVLATLNDYDVLLIGCGLGRHPETVKFVLATLNGCPPGSKVVVDADGLNALATTERWWEGVKADLVLTPHPGEMGRLTGLPVGEVNARRLEVARDQAAKWGKVVVLKGAYTLIASPDARVGISSAANPAMATAGVGDVLAGVISGLLAQGMDSFTGAATGVYVHAEAGARIREELGNAGLLAGDLLGALPLALKSLREIC